jgi:hypothetical protein
VGYGQAMWCLSGPFRQDSNADTGCRQQDGSCGCEYQFSMPSPGAWGIVDDGGWADWNGHSERPERLRRSLFLNFGW